MIDAPKLSHGSEKSAQDSSRRTPVAEGPDVEQATVVGVIDSTSSGEGSVEKESKKKWRDWPSRRLSIGEGQEMLLFFLFGIPLYEFYRSRGAPTFELTPFSLSYNDLFGLSFLLLFLLTRRPSYLVFAINPARNGLLKALQASVPHLRLEEVNPEFYRNIVSSSFQLLSAFAIAMLATPRPIAFKFLLGREAQINCVPSKGEGRFASVCENSAKNRFGIIVAALLVSAGVGCTVYALIRHTDNFTDWLSEDHGLKIILALLLGVSEEVTWREACMNDTNNLVQAAIWGLNHFVVGEGMDDPLVYGIATFGYAWALGVCPYRLPRYFSHVAIEYLVMDNLVQVAEVVERGILPRQGTEPLVPSLTRSLSNYHNFN